MERDRAAGRTGRRHPVREAFGQLATRASNAAGSAWAFGIAVMLVVGWLLTGPLFGFSDRWQLFINTLTTISTFLMVFLLQHAQNKDTRALHLKLDELVAAVEGASNRLIDVEDLSEEELERLHERYRHLAQHLAERERRGEQGEHASVEEEPDQPAEPAAPLRARGDARHSSHP